MPRVTRPARSKRKYEFGPVAVESGCAEQRVAPATPNCTSKPERWPQSTASQTARASARTVDGEAARRLLTPDSSLTSNTVASTAFAMLTLLRVTARRRRGLRAYILQGQNRIMVESTAASARHLTTNRPIFFKLTLSGRV